MKTTILILFTFFCLSSYSQTSDIIWVPSQKSVVATLRPYHSQFGWYMGGFHTLVLPQPYMYRTPLSLFNRVGVNFVPQSQKFSVMGGVFISSLEERYDTKPDLWFNFYPLRSITNQKSSFDFCISVNYMEGINLGVGVSIGNRGIYR
jgi:hypothetical protein